MKLKELLITLREETRPLKDHSDPMAITDCWNMVFEILETLE